MFGHCFRDPSCLKGVLRRSFHLLPSRKTCRRWSRVLIPSQFQALGSFAERRGNSGTPPKLRFDPRGCDGHDSSEGDRHVYSIVRVFTNAGRGNSNICARSRMEGSMIGGTLSSVICRAPLEPYAAAPVAKSTGTKQMAHAATCLSNHRTQ